MSIQVDAASTLRALGRFAGQMPYAIATALNRTGDDANAALRERLPRAFHIRYKPLLRYVAPLRLRREQQATKQNLSVVLRTEGIGRILDPFEQGVPHVAASPSLPVIIPTRHLRPEPMTSVRRQFYPGNLGLTPRTDPKGAQYFALGRGAIKRKRTPFKTTRRGAVLIQGRFRTFVLDPRYHRGVSPAQRGVYQRVGPGQIEKIWFYTDRVPRPDDLHFYETVAETAARHWPVNFAGSYAAALRTAR
jgi:hypothetical protein